MSKGIAFQKPPLTASVLALLALAVLLALGSWQASKYFQRTAQAQSCPSDPVPSFERIAALHHSSVKGCTIAFRGNLRPDVIVPIAMRVHDDQVGYDIHGVLRGADGRSMLVNLGWTAEIPQKLPPERVITQGRMVETGEGNFFSPENNPADNQWFTVRPQEIEAAFDLEAPLYADVLYAEDLQTESGESITRFAAPKLKQSYLQPETHLQYSLFWYAMACALIAVFVLRFIKRS